MSIGNSQCLIPINWCTTSPRCLSKPWGWGLWCHKGWGDTLMKLIPPLLTTSLSVPCPLVTSLTMPPVVYLSSGWKRRVVGQSQASGTVGVFFVSEDSVHHDWWWIYLGGQGFGKKLSAVFFGEWIEVLCTPWSFIWEMWDIGPALLNGAFRWPYFTPLHPYNHWPLSMRIPSKSIPGPKAYFLRCLLGFCCQRGIPADSKWVTRC